MTKIDFEAITAMPMNQKFEELKKFIVDDKGQDDHKLIALMGMEVLEQLMTDLHRSADALEKLAEHSKRIAEELE